MALYKAHGYTGTFFEVGPSRALWRSLQVVFLLVFAAMVTALWTRMRRSDREGSPRAVADMLWCAFAGSLAYFTLNIGVHENHLFVTTVLAFCLLAIGETRARLPCVFCALAFNVNLILFYGLDGRTGLSAALAGPTSIIVSLINTAFFGFCLYDTLRRSRRPVA